MTSQICEMLLYNHLKVDNLLTSVLPVFEVIFDYVFRKSSVIIKRTVINDMPGSDIVVR